MVENVNESSLHTVFRQNQLNLKKNWVQTDENTLNLFKNRQRGDFHPPPHQI